MVGGGPPQFVLLNQLQRDIGNMLPNSNRQPGYMSADSSGRVVYASLGTGRFRPPSYVAQHVVRLPPPETSRAAMRFSLGHRRMAVSVGT
jgi:hypothetical protein